VHKDSKGLQEMLELKVHKADKEPKVLKELKGPQI
jgi:hypothetical protein